MAGFRTDEQAAALLAGWQEEEQRHHEGWDFSHLADRITEAHPPWHFDDECRARLARSGHVLDMGTGGGERWAAMTSPKPTGSSAQQPATQASPWTW